MGFLTALINGLSLGGTYAIIALGYTMVYGIAKMLNFAHGDIIMAGGYIMYLVVYKASLSPILGLLAAVAFCVILGVVIEKLAYKPLRGAASLAVLITAIGMSYLLQSVAQIIFKSSPKTIMALQVVGGFNIGAITIDYSTLLTIGVSVVVMTALTLFIKLSKTGRAMVAVSEDRDAAILMGVNTNAVITVTFAIGSALAALAGYLMLCKIPGGLVNTYGAMPGIKAFTAAVIGGIGSIPGAMIGGILLGVIESVALSTPLAPYTDAIEFAILIILLLVRPAGLLGKKRREKV